MDDVGRRGNVIEGLKAHFNVSFLCAVYNVFLICWMIISFVISAVAYLAVQVYRLSVERVRKTFSAGREEAYRADYQQRTPEQPVEINRRRPAA